MWVRMFVFFLGGKIECKALLFHRPLSFSTDFSLTSSSLISPNSPWNAVNDLIPMTETSSVHVSTPPLLPSWKTQNRIPQNAKQWKSHWSHSKYYPTSYLCIFLWRRAYECICSSFVLCHCRFPTKNVFWFMISFFSFDATASYLAFIILWLLLLFPCDAIARLAKYVRWFWFFFKRLFIEKKLISLLALCASHIHTHTNCVTQFIKCFFLPRLRLRLHHHAWLI